MIHTHHRYDPSSHGIAMLSDEDYLNGRKSQKPFKKRDHAFPPDIPVYYDDAYHPYRVMVDAVPIVKAIGYHDSEDLSPEKTGTSRLDTPCVTSRMATCISAVIGGENRNAGVMLNPMVQLFHIHVENKDIMESLNSAVDKAEDKNLTPVVATLGGFPGDVPGSKKSQALAVDIRNFWTKRGITPLFDRTCEKRHEIDPYTLELEDAASTELAELSNGLGLYPVFRGSRTYEESVGIYDRDGNPVRTSQGDPAKFDISVSAGKLGNMVSQKLRQECESNSLGGFITCDYKIQCATQAAAKRPSVSR